SKCLPTKRAEGRVHAIVPTTTGNKVVTLAEDLKNPNGVALHGNDLYVAESSSIIVFKNAVASAKALALNSKTKIDLPLKVKTDLRVQGEHHWKYIAISPDNKLYVGIGADCNVCNEDRDVGASIFSMDLDGTNFEQVAKGVRNTVGLTFHPVTGQLWFTDNGRDNLGNNLPADELNVLKTPGQDYGFPFCFASNVTDKDFGGNTNCNSAEFTKPIRDLGAHVAALGLTHYTGSTFPTKYKNATFIAEHGSWNSDYKVGYRLTIVEETVTAGKASYSYRPFVSGFADQTENWGRPSDVKNYVDGSLLLSDDKSGIVYKISPK
ncbi:MAG: sorbosone dehydrogenase family protein, partial [Proteobacteria bacterium]